MRETLNVIGRLAAITLVAALLVGIVFVVTKGPIEEQKLAASEEARKAVLAEATEFSLLQTDSKAEKVGEVAEGRANGEVVGYTIAITSDGYGGPIEMMVCIGIPDGAVTGVAVASHSETADLGSVAMEEAYLSQFIGKTSAGGADTISGATRSSNAIIAGVDGALAYYHEHLAEGGGA